MVDVIQRQIIGIAPGQVMTVTTDANSSGMVRRVGANGQNLTGARSKNMAVNQQKIYGPFAESFDFSIEPATGKMVVTVDTKNYLFATSQLNVEGFTGAFTLADEDMGKVFRCDDASNVIVTVPASLRVGFNCEFIMFSTGTVTLAAGAGATRRGAGGLALATQYQRGQLRVARNVAGSAAEFMVTGEFA